MNIITIETYFAPVFSYHNAKNLTKYIFTLLLNNMLLGPKQYSHIPKRMPHCFHEYLLACIHTYSWQQITELVQALISSFNHLLMAVDIFFPLAKYRQHLLKANTINFIGNFNCTVWVCAQNKLISYTKLWIMDLNTYCIRHFKTFKILIMELSQYLLP